MPDFRYILIRYIPDLERMEPLNVGLVLQGEGQVRAFFDPNAARLEAVQTDEYRVVRDVLIREVNGGQVNMFQPPQDSAEFLESLQQFSSTHVRMSRPLDLFAEDARSFDGLFASLKHRLVLKPGESQAPPETRPTGTFRKVEDAKKFIKRGLRRHSPVIVKESDSPLWTAYRQFNNGDDIIVDRVEDARQLGQTAIQVDHVSLIAERIRQLFTAMAGRREVHYYLLADELKEAFPGQTQHNFDLMRKNLDALVERIKLSGGNVLRTPDEANTLAGELDKKLPPPY